MIKQRINKFKREYELRKKENLTLEELEYLLSGPIRCTPIHIEIIDRICILISSTIKKAFNNFKKVY